jgi:protease I
MSANKLKGRRIAVLAADGFEKLELTVPVAALRTAGAHVDIVSLRSGRIRGVNLHEPAGRVGVDETLDKVEVDDYDGLFIPGGFISPDLLRQSADAREFVRQFNAAHKPIATLCHGPWLLSSAELVEGRTMTSWPGIRDDLVNAGATWVDEPVVHDRNWVTGRGPQDLPAFVPAIVAHFEQMDLRDAAPRASTLSSPQRDAPPEIMVAAMKWLPRPSVRVLLGLAVVGGILFAVNKRKDLAVVARRANRRVAPVIARAAKQGRALAKLARAA